MSNSEMDDLVRGLRDLQAEAFVRFADSFGPRLRLLFVRNGLPPGEAEDLAGSCITDISLKVASHYRVLPNASFQSWVFAIARRALTNWWRGRSGHAECSLEELPEVEAAADPTQDLEVLQALEDALQQLTEIPRKVLELRDLGDQLGYAEIGDRLDLSAGNVRLIHHRALRRLRALLEIDPRMQRLVRQRAHTSIEQEE